MRQEIGKIAEGIQASDFVFCLSYPTDAHSSRKAILGLRRKLLGQQRVAEGARIDNYWLRAVFMRTVGLKVGFQRMFAKVLVGKCALEVFLSLPCVPIL